MARNRFSFFKFVFLFLLIGVLGVTGYTFFSDLAGPTISMTPDTGRLSPTQNITLDLVDATSDLKSVVVNIRRSSGATTVLEQTFTTPSRHQQVTFNLKDAGLRDGTFELEIIARDAAFAGFGRGNSTTIKRDMRLDLQPPRITVRTTTPSVRRGSISAIAFTVSEDVTEVGVRIGDEVFPAFQQGNGMYYCFFAFPLESSVAQFQPEVYARDVAGNIGRSRLLVHPQERAYKSDKLNISDGFLSQKSADFEAILPEPGLSDLERYVKINREVRLQDEKVLRGLAQRTAPTMLWEGAFLRLPGSALRASYGDKRTYVHNGVVIDNQTHMGMDLASVAHAPIPAANHGRVVFAQSQGIYGMLVVVDHGLGLMTLYSHMSEILVQEGDEVTKGQIIAHTGKTGLAGGDHLHFGILLNGMELQPLDWLDKNWIKNMITDRLQAAASGN